MQFKEPGVSASASDNLELFSQTAFEQLQILREYAGVLLDPYPAPDVVELLFNSSQSLTDSTAQYGLNLFSEIAGKLARLFQFAQNSPISPESANSIVEFVYDAVALLESDLLQLSTNGIEAEDDIIAFKEKYPFAFQAAEPSQEETPEPAVIETPGAAPQEPQAEFAAAPAEDFAPAEAIAPAYSEDPVPQSCKETMQPIPVEPAPDCSELSTPESTEAGAEETIPEISVAAVDPLPEDSEVPSEILDFFIPEAEEHLQAVTECLLELEAIPTPEVINRLFRAMHTVKGSAAQVGLQRIAHVAHRAEDLVGLLREGQLRPSAEIVDVCLEVVDVLKKFIYYQWPDEATIQNTVAMLIGRMARIASGEQAHEQSIKELPVAPVETAVEQAPMPELSADVEIASIEPHEIVASPVEEFPSVVAVDPHAASNQLAASLPAPVKDLTSASQSKSVRVPLERLDRMMNAVGELVINRTRILGRLGELERLAEVLNFSKGRLTDKVGEFQERYEFTHMASASHGERSAEIRPALAASFSLTAQFRDSAAPEFSDLEWDRYDDFNILSRSLTEISADLTEVLTQLGRFVRHVDSDIDEFTNLAHRLQDEITEARMVPIGNLYTRLSRTARDAAKAAGKQVELVLAGAETDLDNGIIQQISDPLIHLVRNSIAHGIESAEQRAANGKPAQGQVALRAYHRGNQIYIEVEDDGGGIDYERIRSTVTAQQLASSEEAARFTERELLEFLFRPGFSTASRKTELAGRGVGLDVVRANLTALNGEISIETEKGVGTRFTLKVPLTLVITQALFLRNGKWVFGIPLACVEEIRRLRVSEIEEVGGKLLTRVRDQVTEIVRLDARLGLERVEPVNGYYRMVIVNVSGRQVGIIVEEVLRKDEIVIKGMGDFMRNIKLFSGATIAPDGSPILLIEVSRLVGADAQEQGLITASMIPQFAAPAPDSQVSEEPVKVEKVVLLADDSISVRRFVGRMIEKAGYKVKYASDGLEALEIASQGECHMVLTDLEMPRTSGYELMAHLRQNPATRGLPVVVLTSRAGDKHREKALKEGAAGFLTKPVQEDQLIAEIKKYLGAGDTASHEAPAASGKKL
ncbi:MAG TPA: response regulator [Terriglobia bacterium]|nr:response regulator [Terriglobia bacterium]